jgi:rRNA small subunit pseudouridine methyltransferase Nep1
VPNEIAGHPAVKNHARRVGLKPSEILLDRSYHHAAMKKLKDGGGGKRGRPDIVHFALMEALSTPLFMENELRVYVHTVNDKIIAIADNLRIPKSYFRFEGLMTSLFRDKEVKSEEGAVLMQLADGTLQDLLDSIEPEKVIGLSTVGVQGTTAEKAVAENISSSSSDNNCAFVIGAFPRGHFSESTTKLLNLTYSISDYGLEAHVVIARVLYECEKLLEKGVHHKGDKERRKVGA